MHRPTQYRAPRRYAALLLGSLTIHLGFAAIAKAEEPTHNYAVAAQPLNGALTDFADQSDLKLMFPAELARGITSPGVTGALTRDQALARLLADTGLAYRYTGPSTVTLQRSDPLAALFAEAHRPIDYAQVTEPVPEKPKAPPRKDEQGPTVLPEMTVTASPVDETGYNRLNTTTATKTDTPIFDAPVSVQVVPRQVLDDQKPINFRDAFENVSSVRAQPSLGSRNFFIIRGFRDAHQYRNGLRVRGADYDSANLEAIEVLKGPAAVLYGRIQPGGLINLVTKKPLDAPYYSLEQQFGSYDFYRTLWDATGPITQDKSLSYRFTGAYQNSGSFRDFLSMDRYQIHPSITWRPTGATEITVDVEGLNQDHKDDGGIPVIGTRPAPIPISRSVQDPNPSSPKGAPLSCKDIELAKNIVTTYFPT